MHTSQERYRERVAPRAGFYLALLLLLPAVVVVFAPINPPLGWVIGIALYLVFSSAATAGAPVVSIADGEFRAGRATIPIADLGEAVPLRDAAARAETGPGLDGRAYLSIRGALPVVKVAVVDERDPTPYWLVSTRNPEKVAAILNDGHIDAVG